MIFFFQNALDKWILQNCCLDLLNITVHRKVPSTCKKSCLSGLPSASWHSENFPSLWVAIPSSWVWWVFTRNFKMKPVVKVHLLHRDESSLFSKDNLIELIFFLYLTPWVTNFSVRKQLGINMCFLFQHELYLRAFNILNSFEPIKTKEDEITFSRKLKELLEDHQVSQLYTCQSKTEMKY